MEMDRRRFLFATAAVVSGGCASGCASTGAVSATGRESALARLERERGGRLGVMSIGLGDDGLGSARVLEHRADERFPLCSTFKTLLVAQVLSHADQRPGELERVIRFGEADLLEHAPVTRRNLGRGEMSVGELCEAAITVSDNSAANLLINDAGGLAAFNGYLRRLGDPVTRLDRIEPALDESVPGDPRDTTTPRAMAENLRRLFVGDMLSEDARARLIDWHLHAATGPARLRAGIPAAWPLAHKTGAGNHGATNDIGVAWPPGRAPLIVAAYYAERTAPLGDLEAVLAEVGRLVSQV